MTTLANVILRQTAQAIEQQGGGDLAPFAEAAELLRTARDTSQRRNDHAFTVFFNGAIRVARAYHVAGPVPDALREEVQDWLSAAQRSALYQSPSFVDSVAKTRADMLTLAVPRGATNGPQRPPHQRMR